MKLNDKQLDDIARYSSALSVAALLAGVAGAAGHGDLSVGEIVVLLTIAPVLFLTGFFLRRWP